METRIPVPHLSNEELANLKLARRKFTRNAMAHLRASRPDLCEIRVRRNEFHAAWVVGINSNGYYIEMGFLEAVEAEYRNYLNTNAKGA